VRRALAICALSACAARAAAAAGSLSDPMFYLHQDTYQLSPRRLAQWEAGQFAPGGIAWIDLGSIEGGGYAAVERGALTLEFLPRFSFHAELRNDLDLDGRVTRPVGDLLVNVQGGFWIGASGVPAARKQDYGVGGSVLFLGASRRSYLVARLIADQFLYNKTNVDGGTRASPVLHPQIQGRWEDGPWSIAGSLDATTESETSFPQAPQVTFQGGSRRELSLHLRYASPALELDALGGFLRTHDAQTQLGASSELTQTAAALRVEGLLPPLAGTRWRPRLGLRALGGEATSDQGGGASKLTRAEPAARIAAQRGDGLALWELGYVLAVPVLRQTGASAGTSAPYQDKLYGSCDLTLGPVSLRALLSWEIANAKFGGANANVLMQF